ncbi:hypothetical protein SAY86_026554 [Trapa natans]|uniref:Uncharacterized protein n=1 Tax=Trapa natans TaxID=22666 RepID=A0AAN7KI27_TRANT|nr:hypothetical protein SAY86_026554 [Trapa natans]
MASGSRSLYCSSTWTPQENKKFEDAIARFDESSPQLWQEIARAVGSKTVEEVKRHYQILLKDVKRIESGKDLASMVYFNGINDVRLAPKNQKDLFLVRRICEGKEEDQRYYL